MYFAPTLCDGDGSDADYLHHELLVAEESHFWFRARTKLLIWALSRYFPEVTSLLDVGCGRGAVLGAMRRRFPALALSGSEILEVSLQSARRRLSDIVFYQMDARSLPFDREFDVVTSCDVLEHLDDDAAVAREFFRAIVPGGGLIVTVPQHPWLWSAVDTFSRHRRRYVRRQLVGVIQDAGFVVERVTSFVTSLLPLVVISRAKQGRVTPALDPTSELKVGSVTNKLCETALDLERWMIQSGVSFSVGTSLLIVARRPVS